MSWTAITAYILDQVFGYQDANEIRNNLIALASFGSCHDCGGSTEHGTRSASFVSVPDRRRPKINGANKTGMTVTFEGEYRTSDTSTAVSWQVVDLDNASTVVASGGPYSASTNWQTIAATLTLNSGDHRYELQVKGADANHDVFAYGEIKLAATA